MPRKRRIKKEKKLALKALYEQLREVIRSGAPWAQVRGASYQNSYISHLVNGTYYDLFGDAFEDERARRAAWQELKIDILAQHIKHRPGTRPAAWWDYEIINGAKPLRRLISGHAPRIVESTAFGVPSCTAGVNVEHYAEYESQSQFLQRHGLIFKEEIPFLEKDAGDHDDWISYWE